MARNETYGSLQAAIADELGNRQDLLQPTSGSGLTLSPIQSAIQSAISKWEREPFWFNEEYAQSGEASGLPGHSPLFTAMPGQEFYSATTTPVSVSQFATITKISKIHVLINNNRYTLNPRTWAYIENIHVNPSVQSEFPIDYAYLAGILRFYPIPAQATPVSVSFNQYLTPLLLPTDSNAWTTSAYDLIRTEAKLILAQEVLFDDELATRCKTQIYGDAASPFLRQKVRGYLGDLQAESSRRAAGASRLTPTHF